MRRPADERPAVLEWIGRWVSDGVITPAQAERMRNDLGAAETPRPAVQPVARVHGPQRASLVAEALAYLGGVIVLVAAGLIGARYWQSLSDAAQLGIVGSAAAVLLLAGFVVPSSRSEAGARLRSVLWVLATFATGAFLALFAYLVLGADGSTNALFTGAGTAVTAALLWWRHQVVPQQAMFFAATMLTGAAALAESSDNSAIPGLAPWSIGVVWFVLGWREVVGPRRAVQALAAIATLVGALMTMSADAGRVLALCTVVAVVVIAVMFRDLLLLAVGAVGALNVLPAVMNEWFPGDLAAPLVLLVVGALLVTAAVYVAVYTAKTRGKS